MDKKEEKKCYFENKSAYKIDKVFLSVIFLKHLMKYVKCNVYAYN